MPEYSSTTITPADGVKTPAMNGSTSGNYTLSALRDFILASKGQASGLASLDANGKLPTSQLPDLADDVLIYDSYALLPSPGTAGKLYITADTNKGYRWDPDLATPGYVVLFEMDKSIVFGYYSSGSFYEDSEHTVQITPVEHVFYVDVSLADIYVLNDGTLIELLGTKWAKITDIQDGTITAGLATKAFQDAMGNAIITTYATKSELTSEATARANADTDLKAAIQGNSQRIENLEVAVSGSLVQTNTDATMANTKTVTNANEILPWAILKRVGARFTQFNQLLQANFGGTLNNATKSYDSGTGETTFTPSNYGGNNSGAYGYFTIIPNHSYLLSVKVKATSAVNFRLGIDSDYAEVALTTSYQTVSKKISPTSAVLPILYIRPNDAGWSSGSFTVKEFMVSDLTTMNEASLTADQFRAKFPASYYPYDTGHIYPLNPSAFKVVGKNKFANAISIISGGGYYSSGDMYLPKGSYILTFNNVSAYSIKYWLNGSNVSDTGTKSLGAGASAIFSFSMSESGIMSFGGRHDPADSNAQVSELTELMIRPSTTSATYEPYSETTLDTSFTSDYKYVNPSCHDYSENVLVNGVMRRKDQPMVGAYTFTGNEVWNVYGSGWYAELLGDAPAKSVSSNVLPTNVITDTGLPIATRDAINGGSDGISITNITVIVSDKTGLTGKKIYYELATLPDPTYADPIPNIPCEDGTTITAVTPQTDLVNAIDVPSTIAYMTKISS